MPQSSDLHEVNQVQWLILFSGDFIYHGELNIYQEDMNGFIVKAEELGLKGLTGASSEETVKLKKD